MKLTLKNLSIMIELAKNQLVVSRKGMRLDGMERAMTDSEITALAYFHGAMNILGSMGIDTSKIVVEIETPDSEPATD